ncbi:cytochrome P450 2C14-like [Dendropsophus ebraccatus]|uniref:cytochrome P450 2C14-like n=1 Tax=Dendropsophus ebraccatus TaxID=150705 RepID=UPI0038311A0F
MDLCNLLGCKHPVYLLREEKRLETPLLDSSYRTLCTAQDAALTMDLVTVLLSIIVILFFINAFKKHENDKNFPPGPKPLPIIGNILTINMAKPYETFMELAKTYGPVFSVQIGMTKTVVLCGYEAVKDALINHADAFSDRPIQPLTVKFLGNNGVVFSNGENWKVMRRFTLSTLRDYGMGKRTIEEKIIEEAECLVQRFRSYNGKPFDNLTSINAAVANIIVSILHSHRFDYEDPTIQRLLALINENITLTGKPWIRLYNSFPTLMDWLPGPHRTIFENIREFQSFIRATFTKQKKELDINDQRNLVDAFLAKQQEGKPESTEFYHNDNLTVLVGNLFAAGMETTSTTLRWGLLLMMKYPEIQQNVHDEIERVIGSAQPQMEHRKQMPYTDAVIHEIQRVGDIVPNNAPHATSEDVTFRGYFIPKGTVVFPLLHSILREKTYFEKPYEFYPEHFLDSKGNFKKNEAFIPFSIGKRSCAGETLAKMELFLFFTTLLQNFTFKPVPRANLDLTPGVGSTNSPKPFEICAISRR